MGSVVIFILMILWTCLAIFFAYIQYAFWGEHGGPGPGGLERALIFHSISIAVPLFLSGAFLGRLLTLRYNKMKIEKIN